MRTQSVKNLASAFSMVVILAAAPAAFARPAQPRERGSIVATIRLVISRFLGGITSNAIVSPPIPKNSTAPTDPTESATGNGLPSPPIPLDYE